MIVAIMIDNMPVVAEPTREHMMVITIGLNGAFTMRSLGRKDSDTDADTYI